jgi:hypothetical protein
MRIMKILGTLRAVSVAALFLGLGFMFSGAGCTGPSDAESTTTSSQTVAIVWTTMVASNGLCVDDRHSTRAEGPWIQVHDCNKTDAQNFTFEAGAGGAYRILNEASGLCLEGATANAPVVQSACSNASAQLWQLKPQATKNAYLVESANGQSCLSAPLDPLTDTLVSVTACAKANAFSIANAPKGAAPNVDATISIGTEHVGAIGDLFCGLSFNKVSVTDPIYRQPSTAAIFNLLAQGRNCLLRIGGTDADTSTWTPTLANAVEGQITQADIDALGKFIKSVPGWYLLYDLRLLTTSPDAATNVDVATGAKLAAEEAQYVAEQLKDGKSTRLYGFEIGNEPDLYVRRSFATGMNNFEEYWSQWSTFAQAVVNLKLTPSVPLTGPALAGVNPYSAKQWIAPFLKNSRAAGLPLAALTGHYYPGFGSTNATPPVYATIADLLASETQSLEVLDFVDAVSAVNGVAAPADIPFRISETNSYIGRQCSVPIVAKTEGTGTGPCPDAPDGYVDTSEGAALWMIDHLFNIALGGGAGVNVIVGNAARPGSYALFDFTDAYTQISAIHSEFYGLLLFSMTGAGTLLATDVPAGLDVSAYAVEQPDGVNIVINNKEAKSLELALNVKLPSDANIKSATRTLMTAPSITAQAVTIQGASVNLDGTFKPAPPDALQTSGTVVYVAVPAASAALLKIN